MVGRGRVGSRRVSLVLASTGRPLLAEALARLVSDEPNRPIELASDPMNDDDALVDVCAASAPNVLLLDVDGDSPSGRMDLVTRVKAASPRTRVLVLFGSADDRDLFILDYVEAGADGFLDRTCSLDSVLEAIGSAADGALVLPDADVAGVLRKAAQERDGMRRTIELWRSLTEREAEVLGLIARAYTNEQIAEELHVSVRTVATHVQNVYRKMGVHSRLEAVAAASQIGLARLEDAFEPTPGPQATGRGGAEGRSAISAL